jgi:hypothetical protein
VNPENIWINSAITLGAIAFAFFLILFFMRLEGKKENINPSNIVAFIDKYSLAFGAVFIIIGLTLWTPILNGSENMFGYESQDWWKDRIVRNAAFFSFPFLLRAFLGSLALIIGIKIILVDVFRGTKKLVRSIKKWRTRPK